MHIYHFAHLLNLKFFAQRLLIQLHKIHLYQLKIFYKLFHLQLIHWQKLNEQHLELPIFQGNDISTQTGTNPWQNPGQDLRNPGSILCFKMQYQMLLLEGSSSQGYGFFLWSCMDVRVGL